MKATPRPRNRQPCERTTEVKNNTDDNAVLSYRLFECIVLAQTWAHWDIVKRKKQKQKKRSKYPSNHPIGHTYIHTSPVPMACEVVFAVKKGNGSFGCASRDTGSSFPTSIGRVRTAPA